MMNSLFDNEAIASFVENQLASWPEAKKNYDLLARTERKRLTPDEEPLDIYAQCNPERIRSTAAAVDKSSVQQRPCFLCRENRSEKQIGFEIMPGWELLVNPYPILPIHFTIVSTSHRPQAEIPLEMAAMAERAPSLAFFFNGARAGASAPDHAHAQAVLKSELPIIRLTEKYHTLNEPGWISSESFSCADHLPFQFMSAIITPDSEGMHNLSLVSSFYGIDKDSKREDKDLQNAFFWIDDRGYLRIIIIPRSAHRSSHYFLPDEGQIMVSPGALDMAGILVLPRINDFNKLDRDTAFQIYNEVGLKSLPNYEK